MEKKRELQWQGLQGKVKKDKKRWMDNLAQQAKEAAAANNIVESYNLTKITAGKKKKSNLMPVRDNDGNCRQKKMIKSKGGKSIFKRC